MSWNNKMADLMRNRKVLTARFPNGISYDNCPERCSFRSHESAIKPLNVHFTDVELELCGDLARIGRSRDF